MSAHSKNRVKNAGEVLRCLESATPNEMLEAIGVIDEWRADHAKPLRNATRSRTASLWSSWQAGSPRPAAISPTRSYDESQQRPALPGHLRHQGR